MLAFVRPVDDRSPFLADYSQGVIEWSKQTGPGTGDGLQHLSKNGDSYILKASFYNGVPYGQASLTRGKLVVDNLSLIEGKRCGLCTHFDNEGYLMFRGQYENDQQQGYGITYDGGIQIFIGNYNKDILESIVIPYNGKWMEVSSEGRILCISDFDLTNLSRSGIGYLYSDDHILSIYDYTNKRKLSQYDKKKKTDYNEVGDVVYEGEYLNCFSIGYPRNGNGTHYISSSQIYSGQFKNGEYNGEGTLTVNGCVRYRGSWKHNHANGIGTLYNTTGEVIANKILFTNDYCQTKDGRWIGIHQLEITKLSPSPQLAFMPDGTWQEDTNQWWLTQGVQTTLDKYFPKKPEEWGFNIYVSDKSNVDIVPRVVDTDPRPSPSISSSKESVQISTTKVISAIGAGILKERVPSGNETKKEQPTLSTQPEQISVVGAGSSPEPPKPLTKDISPGPIAAHPPNRMSPPTPRPLNSSPPLKREVVRHGQELNSLSCNRELYEKLQELILTECNDVYYSQFYIPDFPKLEIIKILKNSCMCLSCLAISHIPLLQSITIEDNSCTMDGTGSNRRVSFMDLPSLTSLIIGNNCFNNHEIVIFKELPMLTTFKIGLMCFTHCTDVTIEDLNSIQVIQLTGGCFWASGINYEQEGEKKKYLNKLSMKNLEELTRFEVDSGDNFTSFGSVVFENIPKLQLQGCECLGKAFKEVHSLEGTKSYGLEDLVLKNSDCLIGY